jgi:hypothetical protein
VASSLSTQDLWPFLLMDPEDLLGQCRRETYQGSGPGGQKRNRVRSGIRLIHSAADIRAENCEHREAGRNVEAATRGLRLQIALRLADTANQGETQSSEALELQSTFLFPPQALSRFRIEAGCDHFDYLVTAAFVLCGLAHCQSRLAETARLLGTTGSALTRHLKKDKAVWAAALRMRERAGHSELK